MRSTGKLNVVIACKITSYCPSKTSIKAPEIPGNIMAQMAINPEKNNTMYECDNVMGLECVSQIAKIAPTKKQTKELNAYPRTFNKSFDKIYKEATIRPKKNAHTEFSWVLIRYFTIFASEIMAIAIPKIKGRQKPKGI